MPVSIHRFAPMHLARMNRDETEKLAPAPRPSDIGPWRILVLGPSPTVHMVAAGTRVVIGRAEGSDIRLDDSAASRSHAVIEASEGLWLEDLKSSNGTRVRERLLTPGERVALASGDVIEVGSTSIVVQRTRALTPSERQAFEAAPHDEDAMSRLRRLTDRVAKSNINVLILGETGVGKDVLAAELHAKSPRASKPFMRINCAAIAANLIESELFGHERGAFTGADRYKAGLIEAAEGGTVLLDEVGELPMELQPKLLRVLENRELLPVGALRTRPIDVRFLAATNRDLEAEVAAGRFRQDLYYRLNGISLQLSPLRDRRSELEPLARTFLKDAARREGITPCPELRADALQALLRHDWPGNIRELKNRIERALVLSGGAPVGMEHFDLRRSTGSLPAVAPKVDVPAAAAGSLREVVDAEERRRVLQALQEAGGNQTIAAKALGISRRTLVARLSSWGLTRKRSQE